jgi:hypothetical protein
MRSTIISISLRDTFKIILSRKSFLAYAVSLGLCSFSGNAFDLRPGPPSI